MAEKFSDFDYPRWKYHAIHKPRIVNSRKEEEALGPNWENSPAYFSKSEKVETQEEQIEKKTIKDKMWRLLGM